MLKQKISKNIAWDYDVESLDLEDPAVLKWYISRKINTADWRGLRYDWLKQYLPELDIIDPQIRKFLEYFVKRYEKEKRSKKTAK